MRRSIRSALPTLRPVTPGGQKRERKHIFKLTSTDAQKGGEIELNRAIFQDMRPQTCETDTRSPAKKPNKLKPMGKGRAASPRKRKAKGAAAAASEPKDVPAPAVDLTQIEYLVGRMPAPNAEIDPNVADKVAPLLDRILCTVTDMGPEKCAASLQSPIIGDLHERLFSLIDVDDFLTRVIVCRILLNFAPNRESPLLLPISRIFFKLSGETSNDVYFVEESLETVMLTLIGIGEPQVKVMAAGALRNMAASAMVRERLVDSDLFALGFDVFHDKVDDQQLKLQLLGAFKRMCKEAGFRTKIAESHFLSMAANDKPLYCAVLRVAAHLPEMSHEEKRDFLDAFARVEYTTEDLVDATMKCIKVVSEGVEECPDCAATINKLVKSVGSGAEDVLLLIDIAVKCTKCMGMFRDDDVYIEIMESPEYDSVVKSKICELMRLFNDPGLEHIIREHQQRGTVHL